MEAEEVLNGILDAIMGESSGLSFSERAQLSQFKPWLIEGRWSPNEQYKHDSSAPPLITAVFDVGRYYQLEFPRLRDISALSISRRNKHKKVDRKAIANEVLENREAVQAEIDEVLADPQMRKLIELEANRNLEFTVRCIESVLGDEVRVMIAYLIGQAGLARTDSYRAAIGKPRLSAEEVEKAQIAPRSELVKRRLGIAKGRRKNSKNRTLSPKEKRARHESRAREIFSAMVGTLQSSRSDFNMENAEVLLTEVAVAERMKNGEGRSRGTLRNWLADGIDFESLKRQAIKMYKKN